MPSIDYDLEFVEDGETIKLISIGMVRDDGRELYLINRDLDLSALQRNDWLMANVAPSLPLKPWEEGGPWDRDHPDFRYVTPRAFIAAEVASFIQSTPDVELWANYGAYDHVGLAQLWGPMVDLPEGVPMFTNDIQQERARLGIHEDDLPRQESGVHNALADARHNQAVRRWLSTQSWRGAS